MCEELQEIVNISVNFLDNFIQPNFKGFGFPQNCKRNLTEKAPVFDFQIVRKEKTGFELLESETGTNKTLDVDSFCIEYAMTEVSFCLLCFHVNIYLEISQFLTQSRTF